MTDDRALIELAQNIWLAEGDLVNFFGFPYPTRSIIVRLDNGSLWVWSPIRLSAELRRQVDALGPVAHLISPNKLHHLFLQDWLDAYPQTRLWGPATSIKKRPDLAFQEPLTDTAPPDWAGEIDQVWFRGNPFIDEIEFFHRASATAMITDLSQNFNHDFLAKHWGGWKHVLARVWKITTDAGYAPLEVRLSFFNRKAAREAVQAMLTWKADRVIVAHGDPVLNDGGAYLARAFHWLKP